jgi:ribosome recycling factor
MIRHNDPHSLGAKAELAFEDACRKVIERARVSNTKIVICRDGNVVKLSPDEATKELEANLAKRVEGLPES